jgi:AcrR family transcriptional regulator
MPKDDETEASTTLTPRRGYHSPMRQRQAKETRQRIIAATRTLFASAGYANTTLEAIAEQAEVSPKTIAAVFGSKSGILAEIVNPDAFDAHVWRLIQTLRVTTDPVERVALVAQVCREAYGALALELELLRTAHAVAPELADLARRSDDRRREYQRRLITYLSEHDLLRAELSPDEAVDVLWTLTSFEQYRMLVIECHWEPSRYEVWLAEMLITYLLRPPKDD